MLAEAASVLGQLDDPVDAELWGSDLIGALSSSAAGPAELDRSMTGSLVPAAEAASTPGSLALLLVLAAVGSPELRAAAGQAAARVPPAAKPSRPWAAGLGSPRAGDCWHYADVGGRQESLTMTFAYGDRQHAVCVLIDHGRGGRIKDVWVTRTAACAHRPSRRLEADPLVVFEMIDAADAARRLGAPSAPVSAPSSPIRSTTWWPTGPCCAPAWSCWPVAACPGSGLKIQMRITGRRAPLVALTRLRSGWLEEEKMTVQSIDGVRSFQAMVPMRDGVRLNTFAYLPESGGPSYPVILQRTPYGITAPPGEAITDPARGGRPRQADGRRHPARVA